MKIAYINGSPKKGASNSGFLLEKLEKNMEGIIPSVEPSHLRFDKGEVTDEVCEQLFQTDIWLIAFPLYVDGVPSHFLHVMEALEAYGHQVKTTEAKVTTKAKETIDVTRPVMPRVYLCINNGFYEGRQNALVFQIMKHWCQRCGFVFGGGIGHGAGEMLGSLEAVPVGKGPLKNLGEGFNQLIQGIDSGHQDLQLFINPNFPRLLWKIMSTHSFWLKSAKQNGLSRKELYKQW